MKKKIFISFLIVFFFNFIIGCQVHHLEKVDNDGTGFVNEKIASVVLNNYKQITFKDDGGKYSIVPSSITGCTYLGNPVKINTEQVKAIIPEMPPNIKPEDVGNNRITDVIKNDFFVVEFDTNGAVINKSKNEIEGTTFFGSRESIPLEDIWQIYTERPKSYYPSQVVSNPEMHIAQIITNTNFTYVFDNDGGKLQVSHAAVTGYAPDNTWIEINPDSILYANVERTSAGSSFLATIGVILLVLAGIVLIIAATKQSCPFVYSFDGEKYVFDAEPLGGAITRGLERTEYSRLEHLKAVDNELKLVVRNEVEETQYIDQMRLLNVKHDEDKQVYPDLEGKFYQIKELLKPLAVYDENGRDLSKVISENDGLYWQTKMPVDSSLLQKRYRHELTFVFPRPEKARNVKLIVNIGTTLWGSKMIREMLQLYGNSIDSWYSKVNNKEIEYYQMMNFTENEETYKLKIFAKSENKWIPKGFINGGGPLISETRVYNLDISDIKGDSLVLKCNPPYGFWTVDYAAVEYNYYSDPIIEYIPLAEAVAKKDIDVKDKISNRDSIYYVMPKVGDAFSMIYIQDEDQNQNSSTYYLESTGYYELHLAKDQPLQVEKLSRFIIPGEIVRWANQNYSEWKKENQGTK
jgi:hypothetical protein